MGIARHPQFIPESQQAPVPGLGDWLRIDGAAVYGSRPWEVAESANLEGTPLRFTRGGADDGQAVHALVVGEPRSRQISLPVFDAASVQRVRVLGVDEPLEISTQEGTLIVTLPGRYTTSAVTALALGPEVRAKSITAAARPEITGSPRRRVTEAI